MDKCIPVAKIREVWLNAGLTTAEAARAAGLARSNLWLRAKALGLPARPKGRRVAVPDDLLTELWNAGVLCREIANHFGCHCLTVSQSARRLKLPPRPCGGRQAAVTMQQYQETLLGRAMARRAVSESMLNQARGAAN